MKMNFLSVLLCFAASVGTTIPALAIVTPTADSIVPNTVGPTNANTVSFIVDFSLPVINFNDASDVILSHSGTASTTVAITNLSAGIQYRVDIGGITGDGTFTLAANTGSDVSTAGLLPLTSSVTSAPVAIDNTSPSVPAVSDEGAYQVSTNFRFFWNDALITDAGSGVNTVNLQVGTFPGGSDAGVFNVTGFNEYIFSGSPNTLYYARLSATDNAGNTGTGPASDGIGADFLPPTGSAPVDSGFYSNTTNVPFTWATPVDTLSGVSQVILQVGLVPGGNTIFNNDITGLNSLAVPATDGQSLYARLVMIDAVGNVGFTGSSNGILVDSTGPIVLAPTDTDDFETNTTTTFNWITPTDLVSGVFSTRLQIGTSPGLSDVFDALVTGNSQTVPISEGQRLFARLVSRDVAGNFSTSPESDGIIRDTTSPTIVGPFDSGNFTRNSSIVITWSTIEDLGSGLANVQLQVGSNPGAADLFNGTISPTANSQIITGIASGTTAYARIIATDFAGNTRVSASTDGITIDNIAPTATFTNVSDPDFLYHTDFVFRLTASEPLSLLPQDMNLVGTALGTIQILPTANPNVYNVRVVLQTPIVAGSFGVVLNAGATDLAGNPVQQPAVSDLIPLLAPISSSEEGWIFHTY